MAYGDEERDRNLNPEDREFLQKVRDIAKDFGLYFTFSISPIVYNGAVVGYDPHASFQKVFEGPRNLEAIRMFLEGYTRGKSHGRDAGRRDMQAEFRSLLGIEEDSGTLYISR